MTQPVDNHRPAHEDAEARWRREYTEQIGPHAQVRNRSGIEVKPLYTPRDWDSARFDA